MEQEFRTQSESIAALAAALSKTQAAIEGASKDKNNPFFKSKYADLSSVWDACRGPLTDNGLAVVQTTEPNGGSVAIITTLVHSSGEWIRGKLSIKPVKEDPQSIGSAITYARRYALAAIVGVCPEDDDAEAAMARDNKQKPKSNVTKEAVQAVVDSATLPPLDEAVFRDEVNDAVTVKELGAVKEKHKRQINLLKTTDPGKYAEIIEVLSSRKLAIENDMAGTETNELIDDSIPF